ncbi:hypothetical protein A3Q56_06432 [Intoshia linei]|uniref:Protein kinase domain-containing protein n=1 Tax=Intoshia linei TaxID=1819745 RepID=A0A177AV49_9BILA|nr:hypothetical protein A3Q56_06432 [Intoshia linei]
MSVKDVYKLENHSLVSRCNFYIILFNNQNRDNNDSGTGVSVVEYATESKNYNQDFMVNQLKIMSNIRHENIATFLHTFMLNSKLYVIYPEFLFGNYV